MIIKAEDARKDLPPIKYYEHGACNVVLALCSKKFFSPSGSNSYLSRWMVTNTAYYNNFAEQFDDDYCMPYCTEHALEKFNNKTNYII